MRHLLMTCALVAAARAHLAASPFFGGEDPLGRAPNDENWHHEGITRRGAASAGWSAPAVNSLAFHADYVDSYLYNPEWWVNPTKGGGRKRLQAVWSSRDQLKNLHFDDLNTPDQVEHMWERYFSGAVAGLLWAATCPQEERVRISLAHNVIGSSLHAVQDFYSHSNWIDDSQRRHRTWHDVAERERSRMPVWTGTYETADHRGHAPHGEFMFLCAIFGMMPRAGQQLMDLICASWSPLSGTSICEAYDACEEGRNIPTPQPLRKYIPPFLRDKVVFIKPGINLDSKWQAVLGASERRLEFGLAEVTQPLGLDREEIDALSEEERTGLTAFETAYALAVRASCQWLRALEAVIEPVHPDFWRAVKNVGVGDGRSEYISDTGPWEDMAQLPYRFLTAGPYPPAVGAADDGWYVRLHVDTADVDNAGTNADIVAAVDGHTHILNHAPPAHPGDGGRPARIRAIDEGLAYDDHEQSTSAAYVLGPFDSPPRRITLRNDAPDAGDVFMAALETLGRAVTEFFEDLGTFFRSLVGWHPDYIGSDWHAFEAEELNALPVGHRRVVTLRCRHRTEGKHHVRGYAKKTDVCGVGTDGIAWRQYEVGLLDFTCIAEADSDRGTNSDEPFFLAMVTPHGGGEAKGWRSGVYTDVDTGDGPFDLGWREWVRVPEQVGSISLAVAAWESDGESASHRRNLLVRFMRAGEQNLDRPNKAFLVTLSEAFAAGWRPLRVQASAFRRGPHVELITYAPHLPSRWLMGGETLDYPLTVTRHDRVHARQSSQGDCPKMYSRELIDRIGDVRGVVDVPRARWQHNPADLMRRPRDEEPDRPLTPSGGWVTEQIAPGRRLSLGTVGGVRDATGITPVRPPGVEAATPTSAEPVQTPRRWKKPGKRIADRLTEPLPPQDEPPKLDEETVERMRRLGALTWRRPDPTGKPADKFR